MERDEGEKFILSWLQGGEWDVKLEGLCLDFKVGGWSWEGAGAYL
jgi:hypothetical protein